MGKETFTGRTLPISFFKDLFMKVLEESKDSRSFLSFRKQREQDSASPRIFLFFGQDGLGKTSAINACIKNAQEAAEESKKELKIINVDWKQWYLENCSIPSSPKEIIDSLYSILIDKIPGIESHLVNCKSISEKYNSLEARIKDITSDEWPKEVFSPSSFDPEEKTDYKQWLLEKLSAQEIELLQKSEEMRADALINVLIELSANDVIVLTIDSYEYLSTEADLWFREVFFNKIYSQKNRIFSIISGCSGFARGYRNDFPLELLLPFNFSDDTLTRNEISEVCSKLGLSLTKEDVNSIEQCTAGFPLYVRDLANYRINGMGPEIIPATYSDSLPSIQEVAEGITSRFLSYCLDQTTREQVLSLVMLRHFNETFLAQLWGISSSDVRKNLDELSEQFVFISGNSIISEVRYCLFRFLQDEFTKSEKSSLSEFFKNYSTASVDFFQQQLSDMQEKEPDTRKRYADSRYCSALVNYIDGLMWGDPKNAIEIIPGIYLELQYFCPSLAVQLLWQVKEFESIIPEESVSVINQLRKGGLLADRSSLLNIEPVQPWEKEIVDFLSGCVMSSDLQKSLLYQKSGEMELRSGNYTQCMELLGRALSASPVSEQSFFFEDYVMLGYCFLKEGNLQHAASAFSNAVLIRGDRFLPLNELGLAQVNLRQFDAAADTLSRASDINPENQDTWFNLGLAYAAINKHKEAIQAFNHAIEKGSTRAEIWFEAAKEYASIEDFSKAITAYEKVVKEQPENAEAWFRMGQCCSAQGQSEEAVEAFRKAVEIRPDYIDALMTMGYELYNRGYFEDAASAFKQIVNLDKTDSSAWNNLALSYYHAENYESSIEAAKQASVLKSDYSEPLMTIGHAQTALGNFSAADEAYAKASEVDPENPDIWNHIGNSFYAQSLYPKAISAFEKSIELDPHQESTWLSIGLAFQVQEKFAEAVKSFSKAIEIEPGNSESWFQKGRVHMSLEQYKEAAECFGKSVEINPDSHDAWYRRGLACAKVEDHKGAISSFVKASELWASDPDIWYHLGLSYSDTNRHEDAVRAFREASNLAPSRQEIWYNLGLSLKTLSQYQNAIEAFTTAVSIAPERTDTLVNMGQCQYLLQQFADAKQTFSRAAEIDPHNLDTLFHLGLTCHAQGEYAEAIDLYREITGKKADFSDAWYNMALAFHALGDYQKAIEVYNITVSKWPRNGAAWYNLGLVYHTINDLDNAVRAYREASRLNPDQTEIWYNLGIAFHAKEQYGEAIQAYRRTVHLSPENHDAWQNLGLAYQAWGQHTDAIESFTTAIEIKPDSQTASGYLAVSCYEAGEYQKSLDAAARALELSPDQLWITGYALLSAAMTGNSAKAFEYIESLSASDPSGNELNRALYILNESIEKNPSREDLNEIKAKLEEALQGNEEMQIG